MPTKVLSLEECFPILLTDKRVSQLASMKLGEDADKVVELAAKPDPYKHEGLADFYDALVELLDQAESIDSAEIECLSSYSTTSTFDLMEFGGVFFIQNLEFGNIGYFTSAEDAKAAAEESIGFKWDDPASFSFDSKVDDLLDSEEP